MENKDIETLLAKEAIRDQIYTYCRALDWIDNELGYSVFAEDSKVNYGPTFPKGTGRQFIDNMLNQHRHMISTHHMMTNILIKVDGNKAASDIVNIGLHFILKNVRPYAAPCSEA